MHPPVSGSLAPFPSSSPPGGSRGRNSDSGTCCHPDSSTDLSTDRRTDAWSSRSPRTLTHTLTHAAQEPGPGWAPSPPSAACHGFYQTTDRGRVPRPAAAGFRPEAVTLPTPLPFGCFPFGQTSMLPPHDPHGLRPLSPCPRVPLRPRKAWTSSQASGLLLMYSSCPALIMGTNLDGMTFSVKSAS